MIPRIIHQTWKTDRIPDAFKSYAQTWRDLNPGWEVILWSDRMLLDFVAEHYPELLGTYCGYRIGVERADAARYMLLHHFGGLYADLDTECLSSCEPLVSEDRVVLCHEPPSHWGYEGRFRRPLPYLLFNGVMASPAGHPFWRDMLAILPKTAKAQNVLDATGPCLLAAVERRYADPSGIVVRSCHLFNPLDRNGHDAGDYTIDGRPVERAPTLARHHWAGTWYGRASPVNLGARVKKLGHRLRDRITRGAIMDPEIARASVDPAATRAEPSKGNRLAILVPVRDGADQIGPFLDAVARLDHPKALTRLVFCEGDSLDGSFERLEKLTASLRASYREVALLQKPLGTKLDRDGRWRPSIQRQRRASIAKVRNHLIDYGLAADDDWALWIDVDVWRFPADIVRTLHATGGRIVCPNCVLRPGGPSFDRNSFVETNLTHDYRYWRHVRQGLYLPPETFYGRLFLSDFRYMERIELDAVGGTMLLVDAALHRGNLRFPEKPYRRMIETEGFGALAKDLGITPIGLPQVEVLHSPW